MQVSDGGTVTGIRRQLEAVVHVVTCGEGAVLEIVDGPADDDKMIEQNGIEVYVPKKAFVFLAGTVLDFSDGLNGKGFEFTNPNAKTSCGCGTSFSV